MTTKSRSGKKTIPQLDETKLAETLTIEEARDSLFLTQQTMIVINIAKIKTATAIKILVVLSAIKGWSKAPLASEGMIIR